MANTGYILPRSASSTSETGWADSGGAWIDPVNIYGAGEAYIDNNAFDAGDTSHVLRGYNFDLSGLPTGITIDGIVCRVFARATNPTTSIGLAQLLDTSNARVGTNLAATPIIITGTTTAAEHIIGASNNNWGNSLTESWVKNSNFGVAIGVINGANNADVFIDSVELDIYYTTSGSSVNAQPTNGELTITGQSPTAAVTENKNVTPSTGEITLAGFSPSVVIGTVLYAMTGVLSIEGYSPTAVATNNINVVAGVGELTITGYEPTVSVTNNTFVYPSTGELSLTGFAPTADISEAPSLIGTIKSLVFSSDGSPWARISTIGNSVDSLVYSVDGSPWWGHYTPTVSESANVTPGVGLLLIAGYSPTVDAINSVPVEVTASTGGLLLTGYNPTVQTPRNITTSTGQLAITGHEPTVQTPVNILPSTGQIVLTGFNPTIQTPRNVFPGFGELVITGFAPTFSTTDNKYVLPNTGE